MASVLINLMALIGKSVAVNIVRLVTVENAWEIG